MFVCNCLRHSVRDVSFFQQYTLMLNYQDEWYNHCLHGNVNPEVLKEYLCPAQFIVLSLQIHNFKERIFHSCYFEKYCSTTSRHKTSNHVTATSMRRHHVTSTSFRRLCPRRLGLIPVCIYNSWVSKTNK